jgi:ABC-2 type transport system permease protein
MTTHAMNSVSRPATSEARTITADAPSSTLPIYTMHSIRRFQRTGIIWTLAFGLYVSMIVLIFPAFRDSGALDMVVEYPDALKEAFAFEDLGSVGSFVNAEVYSYGPLVLAFLPIMALSSVIAGAEERNGLDILLGTPMPRRHIVLASWIAIAVIVFVVLAAVGLLSWLSSVAVGAGLTFREGMRGAMNLYPITMAVGGLALLFSAMFRSRGMVIGLTFGLLFLMYLLDIISKLVPEYEALQWGSAFRFYNNAIVDGFSWSNAAVLLVASIVLMLAAIPVFDRRDVYT